MRGEGVLQTGLFVQAGVIVGIDFPSAESLDASAFARELIVACDIAFDGGGGLVVDTDGAFHLCDGFEGIDGVIEGFILCMVVDDELKLSGFDVFLGDGGGDDFVSDDEQNDFPFFGPLSEGVDDSVVEFCRDDQVAVVDARGDGFPEAD